MHSFDSGESSKTLPVSALSGRVDEKPGPQEKVWLRKGKERDPQQGIFPKKLYRIAITGRRNHQNGMPSPLRGRPYPGGTPIVGLLSNRNGTGEKDSSRKEEPHDNNAKGNGTVKAAKPRQSPGQSGAPTKKEEEPPYVSFTKAEKKSQRHEKEGQ